MITPSAAAGRIGMFGRTLDRGPATGIGVLVVALVAVVVAAHVSSALFYACGAVLLLAMAYLSYRLPRAVLLATVLTPVVDRYLIGLLIPAPHRDAATYLSEALLLMVSVAIALRAWRQGSLVPALRHPVLAFVAAFAAVGVLSAIVNSVPPVVAAAGIIFTLDAIALFVLPRAIGVSMGYARAAFLGLTVVATISAVLALGQVYLYADFLGMETFTGRFSEGQRIAAFYVNPNMLGAILAMGLPLPVMASVGAHRWRSRIGWGAVAFAMTDALLFTFSRGAWLGLGIAVLLIGVFVNWRALALLVFLGAVALGTAYVVPRHLLSPDPGDVGFDPGGATVGRLDSLGGGDLRVLFIENAAPILASHPVIGAGPGRYGGAVAWRFGSPLYDQYTAGSVPRDRTVDNYWLHLTVEFGVLGSLLFLSAILVAVRGAVGRARRAMGWARVYLATAAAIAVIIVVDSTVEMLLEGNTTSFAVWFFLGLASALAVPAARATREA